MPADIDAPRRDPRAANGICTAGRGTPRAAHGARRRCSNRNREGRYGMIDDEETHRAQTEHPRAEIESFPKAADKARSGDRDEDERQRKTPLFRWTC